MIIIKTTRPAIEYRLSSPLSGLVIKIPPTVSVCNQKPINTHFHFIIEKKISECMMSQDE